MKISSAAPTLAALATAVLLLAATPAAQAGTGPGVAWQAAAADADIDRYFQQAKDRKSVV